MLQESGTSITVTRNHCIVFNFFPEVFSEAKMQCSVATQAAEILHAEKKFTEFTPRHCFYQSDCFEPSETFLIVLGKP